MAKKKTKMNIAEVEGPQGKIEIIHTGNLDVACFDDSGIMVFKDMFPEDFEDHLD